MSQNFQESRLVNDSNLTDYVIRDVLSVFETYGLGPPDIFGICHAIAVDAAAGSNVPIESILNQTVRSYNCATEDIK